MDELQSMLREVFRTKNRMTMAISGTGSAGQEATVLNLVEPGERVLVCVNGVFGGRLADMAERAGGEVTKIERPWGEVFTRCRSEGSARAREAEGCRDRDGRDIDRRLAADRGNRSGRARLRRDADSRYRHGAGRHPRRDRQVANRRRLLRHAKVPGLPAGTGARVVQRPGGRKDSEADARRCAAGISTFRCLANYWGSDRVYHHTAPINMTYALHEALRIVLEEGLEACFARHRRNHEALKAGLAAIGIEYATQPGRELPQLNAVRIPERRR